MNLDDLINLLQIEREQYGGETSVQLLTSSRPLVEYFPIHVGTEPTQPPCVYIVMGDARTPLRSNLDAIADVVTPAPRTVREALLARGDGLVEVAGTYLHQPAHTVINQLVDAVLDSLAHNESPRGFFYTFNGMSLPVSFVDPPLRPHHA